MKGGICDPDFKETMLQLFAICQVGKARIPSVHGLNTLNNKIDYFRWWAEC